MKHIIFSLLLVLGFAQSTQAELKAISADEEAKPHSGCVKKAEEASVEAKKADIVEAQGDVVEIHDIKGEKKAQTRQKEDHLKPEPVSSHTEGLEVQEATTQEKTKDTLTDVSTEKTGSVSVASDQQKQARTPSQEDIPREHEVRFANSLMCLTSTPRSISANTQIVCNGHVLEDPQRRFISTGRELGDEIETTLRSASQAGDYLVEFGGFIPASCSFHENSHFVCIYYKIPARESNQPSPFFGR